MEDINDTIFKAVKANLEKSSDEFTDINEFTNKLDINDLLLKICSGTATEEEKEKWNLETELPEEVTDKLVQSFEKGYNAASEFDKNEIEELKKKSKN